MFSNTVLGDIMFFICKFAEEFEPLWGILQVKK